MSWHRVVCWIVGHNWIKHFEPGAPRLVECTRCGEITNMKEAARQARGRNGV